MKKKMQNKRMQMPPTVNAKIILNIHCYVSKIKKHVLLNINFTFQKWEYFCLNGINFQDYKI